MRGAENPDGVGGAAMPHQMKDAMKTSAIRGVLGILAGLCLKLASPAIAASPSRDAQSLRLAGRRGRIQVKNCPAPPGGQP